MYHLFLTVQMHTWLSIQGGSKKLRKRRAIYPPEKFGVRIMIILLS